MKILILYLLISVSAFGQMETSNWYFGSFAGLKFLEDGTVLTTSDGAINTYEGCSSISDFNGNLLFYTDGRNIWDRNHKIMPNANYNNGTGLAGDPSSTQSGIIIPSKNDPDIYYVFTVDEPHNENAAVYPTAFSGQYSDGNTTPSEDDGLNNGLNYSIVDLSIIGSNGSIGDVTARNIHLLTYNPSSVAEAKYKCSEKISAVKDANNNGYWVVTHFIVKFYAFHVTDEGVNEFPVVSLVTPVINLNGYRRNAIGYLKISPDGTKIAIAHSQISYTPGSFDANGKVYLYDFNSATGEVSNPVILSGGGNPYGVEFSPKCKKLYISFEFSTAQSGLFQYDLEADNIASSQTLISTDQGKALQLAPNGKIYQAILGSGFLGVINSPEEDGLLCNYVHNGQALASGRTCSFGLPPFITSFFDISIKALNTCLGDTTQFEVNFLGAADSILWDFGDGSPASSLFNPEHIYLNPGIYTVEAQVSRGVELLTYTKDIIITEKPVAYPANDITKCDNNNNNQELFDLTVNNNTILGTQHPAFYSVAYFVSHLDAEFNNNPITSPYLNVTVPQTIYARIFTTSNPQCYDITTFKISPLTSPDIEPYVSVSLCNNAASIQIDADTNNPYYTYQWSTGAVTPEIMVYNPGIYTVTVTNGNGCQNIRTIAVSQTNLPTIDHVEIVDLVNNNTATVYVHTSNGLNTTYLYSLDAPNGPFQESNYFEYVTPGFHTVYVYDINGCGVVEREIAVLGIPKYFTPNGDGINDIWYIIGMNGEFYRNSEIIILDRFGKVVGTVDPKGRGWDGTYNGRRLPATDYWYVVKLETGRVVRGHFSIIR